MSQKKLFQDTHRYSNHVEMSVHVYHSFRVCYVIQRYHCVFAEHCRSSFMGPERELFL